MRKRRYFLLLASCILVMGCLMILGGSTIKQTDWPTYLGLTCLILAVCVAALVEALQSQHKRIEELERKLAKAPVPAVPPAPPS